jgi:hypothetical protein
LEAQTDVLFWVIKGLVDIMNDGLDEVDVSELDSEAYFHFHFHYLKHPLYQAS